MSKSKICIDLFRVSADSRYLDMIFSCPNDYYFSELILTVRLIGDKEFYSRNFDLSDALFKDGNAVITTKHEWIVRLPLDKLGIEAPGIYKGTFKIQKIFEQIENQELTSDLISVEELIPDENCVSTYIAAGNPEENFILSRKQDVTRLLSCGKFAFHSGITTCRLGQIQNNGFLYLRFDAANSQNYTINDFTLKHNDSIITPIGTSYNIYNLNSGDTITCDFHPSDFDPTNYPPGYVYDPVINFIVGAEERECQPGYIEYPQDNNIEECDCQNRECLEDSAVCSDVNYAYKCMLSDLLSLTDPCPEISDELIRKYLLLYAHQSAMSVRDLDMAELYFKFIANCFHTCPTECVCGCNSVTQSAPRKSGCNCGLK